MMELASGANFSDGTRNAARRLTYTRLRRSSFYLADLLAHGSHRTGMMTFLYLLPALLSLLLIAAHFVRWGYYPFAISALLVIVVLLLRHRWSARIVQAALAICTLEWIRIALTLIAERQSFGVPYARMAIILFSVAVLASAGAVLLNSSPVRNWLATAEPGAKEPLVH